MKPRHGRFLAAWNLAAVTAFTATAIRAQAPDTGTSDLRAQAAPEVQISTVSRVASMRGPSVTGYVENDSAYRITNVRLRVEATDSAGRSLPPTFGWVYGAVPARGRMSFSVPLPPGAAGYQVSVESFDRTTHESP
jgi:hypothetical protein